MDSINLRDLQQFLYCPHRWGLMRIDHAWVENVFVVKANLMHQAVHQSDSITYANGKKTLHEVTIFHDELDLFGKTDCLSVQKGQYSLTEYKPTKPKDADFHFEDAMQVFAQKVCVDQLFSTNTTCYLYYKNQKTKVLLPFDTEYETYYQKLVEISQAMRGYLAENRIPPIRKGQKCSGCSFKDLCMPSKSKKSGVRQRIKEQMEVEE